MEALKASYGSSSDEDDDSFDTQTISRKKARLEKDETKDAVSLPPPPDNLLDFPSNLAYKNDNVGSRVRSFPHVEGNYALHVYIPVNISSIAKKELAPLVKKAGVLVPELYAIDTDLPLFSAQMKRKDAVQVEEKALASQFHISLSRTVAIRVHQIDSIVTMLRHKLHSQKRYWIEFDKWEVFINDDQTRSFLAMEVTTGGLSEDGQCWSKAQKYLKLTGDKILRTDISSIDDGHLSSKTEVLVMEGHNYIERFWGKAMFIVYHQCIFLIGSLEIYRSWLDLLVADYGEICNLKSDATETMARKQ